MTKFNFTRGSKTHKKTFPKVTKIISKDHSIYPVFFDDMVLREVKKK